MGTSQDLRSKGSKSDQLQVGLVASFDILGYRRLCERNALAKVVALIDQIQTVPQRTEKSLKTDFKEYSSHTFRRPKHLVFADTIIVYLDQRNFLIKHGEGVVRKGSLACNDVFTLNEEWLFFLLYCATLTRVLFDQQLPIRGAIDIGEFYISGQCFAGKPLIDCHSLADSLDLSGVVLAKNLMVFLDSLRGKGQPGDEHLSMVLELIFKHDVPLKDGKDETMHMLNWLGYGFLQNEMPPEISQYVIAAFEGNNKGLPKETHAKVLNTLVTTRKMFSS